MVDLRLLAHYAWGADKDSEIVVKWAGKDAQKIPPQMSRDEGTEALNLYLGNWNYPD